MTDKISKAIIKISSLTLIASVILIMSVLYSYYSNAQVLHQKDELELATAGVELGGMDYLTQISIDEYRVTYIDEDGVVLFDSKADESKMENHGTRPEVLQALESGYGESERYSSTLSEKTFYMANRISDGSVLRVSSTYLTVISLLLGLLQPILLIIGVCIILSICLADKLANKLVEPINNLDLENPTEKEIYEELTPLLMSLELQNRRINRQINDLHKKNQEITFVTENVSDGIVVIGEKGMIRTANKRAKELIHCHEDSYYLQNFRNLYYRDTVENALKGKNSFCSIKLEDRVYRFSASPTEIGEGVFFVFLFITDITEEENALEIRRQFTANVSHELKTPLASIMGSAEIISNGIAKAEDVPHFAQKIYDESARLLELIKDIIKVSRLDEGNIECEFKPVNLANMCDDVVKSLTDKADKKGVSFRLNCDDVKVIGFEPVLHEMIYNLCDNAINYNKENGKILVELTDLSDSVILKVSDSGIGIGTENLSRVFERFYRVDKSHSKSSGGTGLGLSIVKHGAILHKADLSIESKLDEGTKIQIKFNK